MTSNIHDQFFLFIDGSLWLAPMSPRIVVDLLAGKLILQGHEIVAPPSTAMVGGSVLAKLQSGWMGDSLIFTGTITDIAPIKTGGEGGQPVNREIAFDMVAVTDRALLERLLGPTREETAA